MTLIRYQVAQLGNEPRRSDFSGWVFTTMLRIITEHIFVNVPTFPKEAFGGILGLANTIQ